MKVVKFLIENLVESILKENLELSTVIQELKKTSSESDFKYILIANKLGLKKIGEGNSRIVYEINDNWVLKIDQDLNTQQNETEYSFYHNCAKEHKQYFAQCLPEHGPKFIWIIAENVLPVLKDSMFLNLITKYLNFNNKEEFNNLIQSHIKPNVPYSYKNAAQVFIQTLSNAILSQRENYDNTITNVTNDLLKRSSWFVGLINALKECNIDQSDLHYKNWGIRKTTNELVILDYGF